MPRLSYYCLIYTDGAVPAVPEMPTSDFKLLELSALIHPGPQAELYGPHVHNFQSFLGEAKASFLFYGTREVRREAGDFFIAAHSYLAGAVEGVRGFGVDLLKLWPFPLSEAAELPEDPLAEDLFTVGFYEHPERGFRAQTFGLAKLGQREIAFGFKGPELLDEAALLCARLADYGLAQSLRVAPGQTMSSGFDRIGFQAAEGPQGGGLLRSWHAPYIQKALPESLFPGVGALEVYTYLPMSEHTSADLTQVLCRSLEQRQVVESLELSGDSPHQGTSVKACACAGQHGLKGERVDPMSVRDSGWTFCCSHPPAGPHELGVGSLGALVRKLPQILRYLSLPPGTSLEWRSGEVAIDCAAAQQFEDDDEELGP